MKAEKLTMKYCAYVHLGYIPKNVNQGLCTGIYNYLEQHSCAESDISRVKRCLRRIFEHHGDALYPVEGCAHRYALNPNKYVGYYGMRRRKLALEIVGVLLGKSVYRVAAKFLAMVHLGYVPYFNKQGLWRFAQHHTVDRAGNSMGLY